MTIPFFYFVKETKKKKKKFIYRRKNFILTSGKNIKFMFV